MIQKQTLPTLEQALSGTMFGNATKSEAVSNSSNEARIVRLPLSEMHYFKGYPALKNIAPFAGQPYHVRDDDPKMLEALESIKQRGVITPGLVRPDPDGGYEIISGHRRHRASELAGLSDMPVIIREMDDEDAAIELVDANIQREDVLSSEKAWAYRMKLEAMKRKSGRPQNNVSQVGTQKRSDQILAEQTGESRNQIQRLVRLTELIPPLLQMVDDKKFSLNPAVEISFLKQVEQEMLLEVIKMEETVPSLAQAKQLKAFSQEGRLNEDSILAIMTAGKKSPVKVTLTGKELKKYFPGEFTQSQMESVILELLEGWSKANG